MVGGDAGGTSVGVAPAAQWIAVKIFNDAGASTATAIHQGFQWLSTPTPIRTPRTHRRRQQLMDLRSPGCNLEFQLDLRSLRAVGIVPVFAAGNFGSGNSTSASPANYPEAFAVGAANNSDLIYAYSSRGPSACGEAQTVYPELVAPGVNIQYHRPVRVVLRCDRYVPGCTARGRRSGSAAKRLSRPDRRPASSGVDRHSGGPGDGRGRQQFRLRPAGLQAAYNWLAGGVASATPSPMPPTDGDADATPTPTQPPFRQRRRRPPPPPVPALHVGDLDRSTTTAASGWRAKVAIEVHSSSHGLVSGVQGGG